MSRAHDGAVGEGNAPTVGSSVEVGVAREADRDLLEEVRSLLPQLSSSPPPLGLEELRAIVDSPATDLLVARDEAGRVRGMLTLAVFRVPTGTRAWIEDVVVDQSLRGAGIGGALVEAALARAAEVGARTVDLTSRPSREAANRLYQRLGFERRETNVYRHGG